MPDFTDPNTAWTLTANSSPGFSPVITELRLQSLYEANYTVGNIQIGSANLFFGIPGDFDGNGVVDGADFQMWQRGESPNPMSTSDLADWEANYGVTMPLTATAASVPEPASYVLALAAVIVACQHARHRLAEKRGTGVVSGPNDLSHSPS